MTIKASTISGFPIITLIDGKNVNKVKDVIYDSQNNQVKALLIDEKGWFKGAKILLLSDITSIGEDAVTIDSEDCFISSDEQNDTNISVIVDEKNFLTKNQVMTESGKDLGRVTDLYFDFPTGEVVSIEVSKGFLQNIGSGTKNINITDIVTVGTDNLIVKDFTEEDFDAQGQVQGANKVVADTKGVAASVVTKAQDAIEAAKGKIDEMVHSDQVQGAIEKTKEVASNVKDKVVDTYHDTKDNIESGKAQEDMKQGLEDTKSKVANAYHNTKEKVSDTYHDAKDNIESSKAKKDMKEHMDNAKDKVADAYHNTKEKVVYKMDEHMDNNTDNNRYDHNNPKIEVEDTKKIVIK
jgi:uncharacterized protein YrrD